MEAVNFVLVLSFSNQYSPVRRLGVNNQAKVKKIRQDQLQEEYESLLCTLKAADLKVTGRKGVPGTDMVLLLFVKASVLLPTVMSIMRILLVMLPFGTLG
ncbi:hypothetical protein JCM8547_008878 [Rhodosporidiobolus lusitaniae]